MVLVTSIPYKIMFCIQEWKYKLDAEVYQLLHDYKYISIGWLHIDKINNNSEYIAEMMLHIVYYYIYSL